MSQKYVWSEIDAFLHSKAESMRPGERATEEELVTGILGRLNAAGLDITDLHNAFFHVSLTWAGGKWRLEIEEDCERIGPVRRTEEFHSRSAACRAAVRQVISGMASYALVPKP